MNARPFKSNCSDGRNTVSRGSESLLLIRASYPPDIHFRRIGTLKSLLRPRQIPFFRITWFKMRRNIEFVFPEKFRSRNLLIHTMSIFTGTLRHAIASLASVYGKRPALK